MEPTTAKKSKASTIIIAIIVIIIIIVLAMAMVKNNELKQLGQQIEQKKTEIMGADAQVKVLQNQGTSTNPSDIQADLKATNVDTLDAQ